MSNGSNSNFTTLICISVPTSVTTAKRIRRLIEEQLKLEPKSLDKPPHKAMLTEYIDTLLLAKANEADPRTSDEGYDSPTSDTKADPNPVSKGKPNTMSPVKMDNESDTDRSAAIPPAKRPAEELGYSDLSELEDEAPPVKKIRKPKGGDKPVSRATTSKSGVSSVASVDKTEHKIKQLKMYITKCGVRKVWSRELADLSPKQQIQKLQSMLVELGVEGIAVDAIIDDGRSKGRVTRGSRDKSIPARPKRIVESDEEDDPVDFSFLGDDVE
ncbi:hypothetical protein IWQ60_007104 [Tieghemiomyces parasiticus]|uniref:Uncharacterized protein n=1 Tax=Tieghemiomyces parasiticus TaxID=78921 RepID=A0A9W8A941_9FUNG|nr:hypothetical protein IWQ60_007104 [Tieghemiomyces parasiticus]